jgi:FKBP-type peptidyl-prolyl cis-trans isomerase FkpA
MRAPAPDHSYSLYRDCTFRLGAGQVIPGWNQGLPGMRAGNEPTPIIPASLACGQTGSGTTIPPDAPLIFEVDLVSVRQGLRMQH